MKKIYSLFAAVVMAVAVNAQTTLLEEDFSSITTGNDTSTTGSGTLWGGNENFPTVNRAYQAGGAVKLGANGGPGFMISKPLDLSTDGGAFTISFDVKGWTTVEGDIIVEVTGQESKTISYEAVRTSNNYETISLDYTGGVADATVTISTSRRRAFVDNVKVVTTEPLAVVDVNAAKKTLVRNTQVANELIFAAKADVKIVNMNGQVVKSASVNENTSLNVSELPKGIYIVTGNVAGQAVSQKIMKK